MLYAEFIKKAARYQAETTIPEEEEEEYENGEWSGRADALIWVAQQFYHKPKNSIIRDLQAAYDASMQALGKGE